MNLTETNQKFFTLFLVLAMLLIPLTTVSAQSIAVVRKQPTSSSAMQLVTGDSSRSSITVQNVGAVNVSVGNISTVTSATGFVLAPSQQAVCVGITDQFYAIAASSTADLRVVTTTAPFGATRAAPQCQISRFNESGITNTAANTTIPMSDGTNVVVGNVLVYMLTTAITANSTTTAVASGSYAITSNATGLGTLFRSDGSKWQLLATYSDVTVGGAPVTIATTSTSDIYAIAPCAGTITGIDFTSIDALSANNSNYITFTATNLGQSGAGSTALLAASDANTTKSTGGTALTALARRSLTVTGTASDLIVAKGDVIRVRATATGTLAGTVTGSRILIYLTRLS